MDKKTNEDDNDNGPKIFLIIKYRHRQSWYSIPYHVDKLTAVTRNGKMMMITRHKQWLTAVTTTLYKWLRNVRQKK